jgi:hypothetical protein
VPVDPRIQKPPEYPKEIHSQPAGAKVVQVKRSNLDSAGPTEGLLDDIAVKTDGLVVNNFCLSEEPDEACKDQAVLKLCACYRSRATQPQAFCVMMVGLDETGDMLWACNLAGTAEAGKVGVVPESALLVPARTLKRTVTVRLRVNTASRPKPHAPVAM